jgi:hypothetical protein
MIKMRLKLFNIGLLLLLFFSGLGFELFYPTLISFISYKAAEKRFDDFIQRLEEIDDRIEFHNLVAEYGLNRKKVDEISEEFLLPLYFIDSESDEEFSLIVAFSGSKIIEKRATWNIYYEKEKMDVFSNEAKRKRAVTRNGQIGKVIACLIIYVLLSVFLFIGIPRILSFARGRGLLSKIFLCILSASLILVGILGLLFCMNILIYARWHSLLLLSNQII